MLHEEVRILPCRDARVERRSRRQPPAPERGLELLRPRRDPLLFDVDARGAEGAPFETAVLVRPVDRCLGPPDNDRRGAAARRSTRHERARGQEPHRPARDPPGGDRNGDGGDRSGGPREPSADGASELPAGVGGRQSISAPLDRHTPDVVHPCRDSTDSRPTQPRAPALTNGEPPGGWVPPTRFADAACWHHHQHSGVRPSFHWQSARRSGSIATRLGHDRRGMSR
jgi:hypothetical protein